MVQSGRNPRRGKWVRWLSIASLALGLAWAASGSAEKAAPSDPWLVENGTVRLLRIAGHGYAVPLNYMDLPRKPGLDQEGLLLTMLWPGLEPRTPANLREFTHVPGWGRRVNLLIQDNPGQLSGDRLVRIMFDIRRSRQNQLVNQGPQHGLVHFVPMTDADIPHGSEFDFFVEGPLEAPTLFIRCSLLGRVPKPGCGLWFAHNKTWMNINFERTHLPNWKEIHKNILQLLARFSADYARYSN